MPVYRVPQPWLREAVESVLGQTYENWELLIADDGSDDSELRDGSSMNSAGVGVSMAADASTAEAAGEDAGAACRRLCDEFALRDPRIRVFHIAHGGASRARNVALDLLCGDCVFFLDGDDRITPECFESLIGVMQREQADAVMFGGRRIRSGHDVSGAQLLDGMGVEGEAGAQTTSGAPDESRTLDRLEALEALCYVYEYYPGFEMGSIWGLISREALGPVRFNRQMTIGEDFEFKYRILQRCRKVICVSGRYYIYRLQPGSVSLKETDGNVRGNLAELGKLIREERAYPQRLPALICRAVNIALLMYLRLPEETGKHSSKKSTGLQARQSIQKLKHRMAGTASGTNAEGTSGHASGSTSGILSEQEMLERFLRKYRRYVLSNRKARKKVRAAMACSCVSFTFMRRIFAIMKPHWNRSYEREAAGR